jgi:nucleoid DNA-binding protein
MTPQQVAQWMALLHKKLLANIEIANKKIANKRVIKLKELVQQATQNNPALENLSTEQAIMLVENIFEQINQRTNSIDDGSLTIAGLGKFHIKSNQQKPLTKKRMVFHSSHPKKNEN